MPFNNANVGQLPNNNEWGVPDFGGTIGVVGGLIEYTDTTAKELATIPKNAVPVMLMVSVTEDFDDSTGNDLEIGIATDADYFATAIDIGTVGNFLPNATGVVAGRYGVKLTSPVKLQAKYTEATGNASQGKVNVLLFYYLAGDVVNVD